MARKDLSLVNLLCVPFLWAFFTFIQKNSLLTLLVIKCMVTPHQQEIPGYPAGIWEVNSILTLSNGDSIRLYRLGTQSLKTVYPPHLTQFRFLVQTLVVTWASDQSMIGSDDPSSGLIYLLERLIDALPASMPSPGLHSHIISIYSPVSKFSKLCLFVFSYRGVITWSWLIKSLAFGNWSNLQSLSPLWGLGETESSNTLITGLASWQLAPILRFKIYLINITKDSFYCSHHLKNSKGFQASQVALGVKYLSAKAGGIRESVLLCLGWENPWEEGMVTRFSVLVWRIQCTEEFGGLQSIGLQRARHDRSNLAFTHSKRFFRALCQEVGGSQSQFTFPITSQVRKGHLVNSPTEKC